MESKDVSILERESFIFVFGRADKKSGTKRNRTIRDMYLNSRSGFSGTFPTARADGEEVGPLFRRRCSIRRRSSVRGLSA